MSLIIFALAFLLASTTFAQAGPLVAGFVGLFGLTGTAAAIATSVATAALSIGVSYLANKLLAPEQQKPPGGVELDIRVDADVPQSLIVGRCVTAGSLVHAESFGSKNQKLIEVIALADHPCEGLVEVYVEGQQEDYTDTETTRGNTLDAYDNRLAFAFFDGAQTAADDYAVSNLGSNPERPWSNAMVGRNVTYARPEYTFNREKITGQMRWKWVVDGAKLYDPRKDTTAGGDGDHRFDDLDTHEFTRNLPCIAYNILRGIRVKDANGDPVHFYGLENTTAASLPFDVWVAAMNEADTEIDGEPQFWGGGEITVDTEPLEAVREIVKSMDGMLVEIGGIYKIYVGAPGLPVLAIDDGMLLADEGDTFRPIRPLQQRLNHVSGKYTSPGDGWVEKIAPARTDDDALAADGRRVSGDLNAPFIQSSAHMQRMMQQMLRRARKERRHVIPLGPECWGLEPGDVIEWTSTRNGYDEKLFRIDAVEDHHDLSITVTITEMDEADYDWDAETDLIEEPAGSTVQDRPEPKLIDGFNAAGFVHEGDSGARRPAIRVTWTDPEDDDIVAVHVQYRRAAAPLDVATATANEPTAEEVILLGALAPETDYEVRGRFESFEGYATDWSLWIPVTTPATGVTVAELDASLKALLDQLDVFTEGSLAATQEWLRGQVEILAQGVNGQFALIEERENSIVIALGSRLGDAEASITQVQEVITDDLVAVASIVQQLLATNENGTAQGTIQFQALADEAGVAARYGIFVRADTESEFAEAGWLLEAVVTELGGDSRVTVISGQFVIRSPEGDVVFDDGKMLHPQGLMEIDPFSPHILLLEDI